jgi:SCY1-like protein 1
VEKFSVILIQDVIFTHFASGFADTMPELRERTLKASILLISKLTPRQINNDLVRNYTRLQSDVQPGIRVNAIICFGKIATKLEQSTKSKLLIGAISKALQDPFPPSRSTGLIALVATMNSLGNESLARHLLPLACPLLVDPEQSVLDQAMITVKRIIEQLERAACARSANSAELEDQTQENSSQWAGWGLGTLTSQVSKLQLKYAVSGTGRQTAKMGARIERPVDEKVLENCLPIKQTYKEELPVVNVEVPSPLIPSSPQRPSDEPGVFAAIGFNNGWDDSEELDPWAT